MILKISFDNIFSKKFLRSFNTSISLNTICMTLVFAFILSLIVFIIYKITCKDTVYSKKFNISMCLMSIVTAAIVLSMQSNITVSLGMVGALSIVRFRTAIKEPRDLLFLFWSISNGIIIGAQIYSIAVVLVLVLSIAMLFFNIIPDAKKGYILVVNFKNVDSREFELILKANKIKYKLKSENISSNNSNCIYEVHVKKSKEFIKDISKIKGVSEVNLISCDNNID